MMNLPIEIVPQKQAPAPAGIFWIVRGDEELTKYNYMSRTAAPDWGYLRQTPSVFRFDRFPQPNVNDWRVDITPLDGDVRRINNFNHQMVENYLYADGTAMFNKKGFPWQQYLVMSFCVLKEIETIGKYLKFETITPDSDASMMTYESHPWFVHRWDLVSGTSRETTKHTYMTPKGPVYHFCVTNEGYGYIPLELVRRLS